MTDETFAEWLSRKAVAAGYDVNAARGGRAKLAEAAGMSGTQVSRTLEGKTTPSVESQRGLARALHVPFSEMLIRSGFATPDDFPNVTVNLAPANSLDALADELDATEIERSIIRSMLVSVIEGLRDAGVEGRKRSHTQRGVGGHPRPQSLKADEPPEA